MIAFTTMLVEPAKNAGMRVPENVEQYDPNEYPHFHVFCTVQIGAALPYPAAFRDNAHVIAGIHESKIRKVTMEDLMSLGLHVRL